MSIYAGTEGYLDDVPVKEVARFEEQFLEFMRTEKSDLRNRLFQARRSSPTRRRRPEGGPGRVQVALIARAAAGQRRRPPWPARRPETSPPIVVPAARALGSAFDGEPAE